MKKITFILFALIAGTGFAQEKTANADVLAEIVTPLTISAGGNLIFGTLVPNATDNRTVSIAATAGATRSSTNTDVLVAGGTTSQPASFDVTSSSNDSYTYGVTVKSQNLNLLKTADATPATMAILYSHNGDTGGENVGAKTIYVGGELTLTGAQPQGSYSDKITVTVSYN